MSWSRYLNNDWWQTEQIEAMNRKIRGAQSSRAAGDARLEDEIEQLSNDLGRALLLLHSLVETCVRKEVLTRDEIREAAREIDLADGVLDGKVDPSTLRPESETAGRRPETTLDFLRRLEREPIPAPRPIKPLP
jgi:hypothetical protein